MLSLLPAASLAGEAEWNQLRSQADLHFQRGSFEQAERFAREMVREAEASFGANHAATVQSRAKLAFLLRLRNKAAEALPIARRVVEASERLYGPDHPGTAIGLQSEAEVLYALKRVDEAEAKKLREQARAFASPVPAK